LFDWFKREQRRRRKTIKLDRKHLEARARRFLKSYLDANEERKPHYYGAVDHASRYCQRSAGDLPSSFEFEDAEVAEATSKAAMTVILAKKKLVLGDKAEKADFVTDAYATVGIAYHRAAGLYSKNSEMQALGTAAVHLLTIATSYLRAEENN
jgi:hypothetical protein